MPNGKKPLWKRRWVRIVSIPVALFVVIGIIAVATGSDDKDKTKDKPVAAVSQSATPTATITESSTPTPTKTSPKPTPKKTKTAAQIAAAYKASCKTVAYKVIEKNPDAHTGDLYAFKGQVFQIQEDADGNTFMLVSVTYEEYDVWDDNIAVAFEGTLPNVYEDDIVQIWGMCLGSYSYESQAGYNLTIPSLYAEYVTKIG